MSTDQLTARMDRLERRCQRLTIAATGLGLALAGTLTMGAVLQQDVPDVVKAKSFEMVDDEGRGRWWAMVTKDGPVLLLGDEDRVRWGARVTKDGPGLDMLDEKGRVRWTAGVREYGPALGLADENGTPRATLGSTKLVTRRTGTTTTRPESSLVLYGPDGSVVHMAPER